MRRVIAYGALVLTIALVLLPVFRPSQRDSFPLSTYPMFSERRGRVSALPTAVGVDASGAIERLSPELIAGGYEPVRAFAVVDASIARGDTDVLCDEIAARVAVSTRVSVSQIEVITETHDVVAWFAGDREPLARDVHARCLVPRRLPGS